VRAIFTGTFPPDMDDKRYHNYNSCVAAGGGPEHDGACMREGDAGAQDWMGCRLEGLVGVRHCAMVVTVRQGHRMKRSSGPAPPPLPFPTCADNLPPLESKLDRALLGRLPGRRRPESEQGDPLDLGVLLHSFGCGHLACCGSWRSSSCIDHRVPPPGIVRSGMLC